jgi:hypothetical protein
MAIRWTRLFVVLVIIWVSALEAVSAAAPHPQPTGVASTAQGDGPLLPPVLNPDDDGDGVADGDDSAPNDPTEGEAPAPGPTDPANDNDDDGLPNVMDPDDTNDGQPDSDEGIGTVDEVPPVPVKEEPVAPVADSPGTQAAAPSHEGPLVLALPSTGSGVSPGSPALPLLLSGATLLLAASGVSVRRERA